MPFASTENTAEFSFQLENLQQNCKHELILREPLQKNAKYGLIIKPDETLYSAVFTLADLASGTPSQLLYLSS